MAKYLLNTTPVVYLFKGGNIEVFPKVPKPVSDMDFDSGIFEDAILSEAISVYSTLDEAKAAAATIPAGAAPTPATVIKEETGATEEELKAFLTKQKEKAVFNASKYDAPAEPGSTDTTQGNSDAAGVDAASIKEDASVAVTKPAVKKARVKTEASTPEQPAELV